MKNCVNCGFKNTDDANFCPNCGARLKDKIHDISVQKNKSEEKQIKEKVLLPPGIYFDNGRGISFVYDIPNGYSANNPKWKIFTLKDLVDEDDIKYAKNPDLVKIYVHILTPDENVLDIYIYSKAQIYANPNSSGMFRYSDVEKINFLNFDTSKVQNMSEMFRNCKKLRELDLSTFTTENIDNLWYMFEGCDNLEKINFSKIDSETTKYLIYILNKFSETFDFNKIDTSLASENDLDEDYLSMIISMFDNCDEIKSIILPDQKEKADMEIKLKRQELRVLKCSRCNSDLEVSAKFCPSCGTRIEINEDVKRVKIAKLARKYAQKIPVDWYVSGTSFESITDKEKKNLLKFDKNIYVDDFVYMYDKSILHNCTEGMLFMLSGIYVKNFPLGGANFFRYSDISSMSVISYDILRINLPNNTSKEIAVNWKAEPLKELLEKIIEIDKQCDTSYTNISESGHTSGILGQGNRKAFMKGQRNGYIRCSKEYELKLRKQAETFFKQIKDVENQKIEYQQLLDEYEMTIEELEIHLENSNSKEYDSRLTRTKETYNQLLSLQP